MSANVVVTADLSRILGVSMDRINRAHRNGLPEPARAGNHRVYTPEEVEAARRWFAERQRPKAAEEVKQQ